MKARIAVFFFLTTFAASAFAVPFGAGKAGDGGHLVTCDAPRYERGVLLDTYEGKAITGNSSFWNYATPVDLDENFDVRQIREARRRLAEVVPASDPVLTVFDNAIQLDRFTIVHLVNANEVGATNDVGMVQANVSAPCKLIQVAARRQIDGQEVLFVDHEYCWLLGDLFGPLFIHEAFHEYFGHQPTTLAVREVLWWLGASESYRKRTAALVQKVIRTRLPIDPELFRKAR